MTRQPRQAPPSLEAALGALVEKYRALVALRREREALEDRGILRLHGPALVRRRAAQQTVTARFPGALRELEYLSAERLAGRLQAVRHERAAARREPSRARPRRRWVRLVLDHHAILREGLRLRRWLRQHRHLDDADLVLGLRAWYLRRPQERRLLGAVDRAFVYRYRHPPRGRFTELVWEILATRHHVSVQKAKDMVWGLDG